ncbi:hypothetical protein DL89DRAFT_23376 [Linderina pennispora]|uniref:Uncharacterized protein n=1 Tax=Linderina pennispora TaxID=61395 RepID=A0A1Y1WMP2_9FUNG|nr:uncharacterized protein DL89DRAFT_23376 [Linderina pennispora]ORX74829.1 hypothetical protein DL89DRAFT_23376 [Linderina pennispora]
MLPKQNRMPHQIFVRLSQERTHCGSHPPVVGFSVSCRRSWSDGFPLWPPTQHRYPLHLQHTHDMAVIGVYMAQVQKATAAGQLFAACAWDVQCSVKDDQPGMSQSFSACKNHGRESRSIGELSSTICSSAIARSKKKQPHFFPCLRLGCMQMPCCNG